jgi:dihydrofolate synthase/folylpolyglutamate synthase
VPAISAEARLDSLEPFGWRFGLERIRALVAALGLPQHRFASAHVVGTNGKTSVTLMTAALLERSGVATGSFTSPHAERWSERVRVGGAEIAAPAFDAAVARVAEAIPAVERGLSDGDRVTQFEALVAAAFVALAAAKVEVAVVEAGLGGRLDATNVLPSRVTALPSIGLDHTELLGETEVEVAAEKLAVLRDHSALVTGKLGPAAAALAERTAAERSARLIGASPVPAELAPELPEFGRRNLGVAVAVAGELGHPPSEEAIAEVAALPLQGRLERIGGDPPLVLDAAHNPAAAAALAEALAAEARPPVACIAILADKDAAGICGALAPVLAAAVCTEVPPDALVSSGRPGARSLPAGELAAVAAASGLRATEAIADPARALERGRELGREAASALLVTGTHYLLRYAREAAGVVEADG